MSLPSELTGRNGDGAPRRLPQLSTTRPSPRSCGTTVRRTKGASRSRLTGPWAVWRRAGKVHLVRPVGFSSTLWYRYWPLIARGWPRVKLTCRPFSRSSLQKRSVLVADEFEIRDLQWLSEIVEQIEAFPDEDVSELARIIHRARMAGAPRNDSELRLALERTIQQARAELITGHDTARREEARASVDARNERKRREKVREALVERMTTDLRSKARRRLFRRSVGALVVAGVLGFGMRWLALWAGPELLKSRADLVAVGLGTVGVLGPFGGALAKWIWPRYREERDRAPEDAERQARKLEGREPDAE